jgi:hypothetical protein
MDYPRGIDGDESVENEARKGPSQLVHQLEAHTGAILEEGVLPIDVRSRNRIMLVEQVVHRKRQFDTRDPLVCGQTQVGQDISAEPGAKAGLARTRVLEFIAQSEAGSLERAREIEPA